MLLGICFDFPRKLSLLLWRIYGARSGSLFSGARWLVHTSTAPCCEDQHQFGFHPCDPPCCFCNKHLVFQTFLWSPVNVVHVTLHLALNELWQFTCSQFNCFHWHYMLSLSSISKKTRWNYFLFIVQFILYVYQKLKRHMSSFCQNQTGFRGYPQWESSKIGSSFHRMLRSLSPAKATGGDLCD